MTGQDWLWSGGLHSAQDWEALHTCAHVSAGLNPVLPALLAWGLQVLKRDGLDVGAGPLTNWKVGMT